MYTEATDEGINIRENTYLISKTCYCSFIILITKGKTAKEIQIQQKSCKPKPALVLFKKIYLIKLSIPKCKLSNHLNHVIM